MMKAAAAKDTSAKANTLRIVREALHNQEQKFKHQMESREQEIIRQQEMLIAQRRELIEKEKLDKDPNIIQITELQKLS